MRRKVWVSSVLAAIMVAVAMVLIPPNTSWAFRALIGGCVGFLAAILAQKMTNAKRS
jgi:peptidoglycan/LPS O-acetylase OafA/YrhL